MYDIHSHIAFGQNEEDISLERSLRICRAAAKSGIRGIVATPRYRQGTCNIDPAAVIYKIRQLNEKIKDMGLGLRLYPGMEIQAVPHIVKLYDDRKVLALNCKRYMLISLPENEDMPVFLKAMLFDLEIRGLRPVIAHPERCRAVIREPDIVMELIDRDSIIQMDSGSILGLYGKDVMKLSRVLLKRNMVHVISSNHHADTPPICGLHDCYNTACKIIGQRQAEKLFIDNPYKIINGEDIQITDPEPAKKTIFQFGSA